MTLRAYRFALDPTPVQERALRSHAGAARVAFNWGLARVKAVMDQRAAEATYGITGGDLTPGLSWSLYSLRKDWNAAKDTVAPWWAECSKEAFNTGLDQLAQALKNWGGSRTGQRKGKPAGFPRFKSRRKARPSIRFTTGAFRCEARHAVLPRIGHVKLHEPGTRLAGLVAAGTGRVMAVSVRFERGRWFAAFTVDTVTTRPAAADPDAVVGIDLGIKTLAVLSTGEEIPSPRHLGKSLRKVRRLSRTVSRLVADRWFASSKTCSGCGTAKTKLALSERTYVCTACGLVLDRDVNAARNLAAYGEQIIAGSGPEIYGRGADHKTTPGSLVAVKRQPGTAHAGQTGTVPPQGRTAA